MALFCEEDPDFSLYAEDLCDVDWYEHHGANFLCTEIIEGNFAVDRESAPRLIAALQRWLDTPRPR